jgi:hypothetical protein
VKNLQEATERICELKGNLVAVDAFCGALLQQLEPPLRGRFRTAYEGCVEIARTSMLNAEISDLSITAFEHDVARVLALVDSLERQVPPPRERGVVETLLLAAPRVSTFRGQQPLTGASGFLFERDGRLYLVTSRHVLIDEPSEHRPDRLEIELHTDERDLSQSAVYSLLLYERGRAVWHQARDSGGEIDVAAIEIDRAMLRGFAPRAFTPAHLQLSPGEVEIGTPLLVVGFPLGFHDGRHHLPVARQAVVASSFGTRFQGQGLFLTDARTHRGTSGAPVVLRSRSGLTDDGGLPWKLLGIHSARMDMGGRDLVADESLGLNCAWYADILLTLTEA